MVTAEPKVWAFFYGSYMNHQVLREADVVLEQWDVARLPSFEVVIRPLANLVRSDRGSVYGIVGTVTHGELGRLYARAKDARGQAYLPEAVLTESRDGRFLPALCYVAHDMPPAPAELGYVNRIVAPAKAFGFPAWYIEHLERFRP